jgi:hypothetical protein
VRAKNVLIVFSRTTNTTGWCEERTANSDDAFNSDGVFPVASALIHVSAHTTHKDPEERVMNRMYRGVVEI